MSEYANIDRMIEFYDPSEFVDACKCDPDANYTCELCMTSSVLMEAKRMLLAKDAQIINFRDANRKLHRRAQRAEAEKTDANIAGFREGFNGAEDQIAELKGDVERLHAEQNAIWDLLRENHISYAEKGLLDTIRRLIEAWHDGQDEIERLRAEDEAKEAEIQRIYENQKRLQAEVQRRLDDLDECRLETVSLRKECANAFLSGRGSCHSLIASQNTEIDRLKALALRAWHSYRSGLACQNGLTDDDIETLVKMDAERSENGVPVGGCTPVQSQ